LIKIGNRPPQSNQLVITASAQTQFFGCFIQQPFGRDIERFDLLLGRMFGTSGDGIRDRLTVYSRPVTGAYWFAPSEEELASALRAT